MLIRLPSTEKLVGVVRLDAEEDGEEAAEDDDAKQVGVSVANPNITLSTMQ